MKKKYCINNIQTGKSLVSVSNVGTRKDPTLEVFFASQEGESVVVFTSQPAAHRFREMLNNQNGDEFVTVAEAKEGVIGHLLSPKSIPLLRRLKRMDAKKSTDAPKD